MEVSHLEPIGLILDADVIQLNEYLGRFNVVATVPLERRAQRRFYFCFMCVQAIECSLVFLLISSAKYDLCPRCIKVCYAAKIENGCATIKEDEANKIRKLYENYLSGMALAKAAAAAGIETYHGTAKRLMENRHYLGDDFYPAIIDQETYDKAAAIRFERAGKLGRLNRKKSVKPAASPTGFRMAAAEQNYEDPRLQAEYLYSLIESEVS